MRGDPAIPQVDRRGDPAGDKTRVFVLPESQHSPTGRFKGGRVLGVALTVPGDLWSPVVAILDVRPLAVLGAAMPEAAITEHRHATARERDVWPNRPHVRKTDRQVHPEPEAFRVQSGPDR
jgi:hypothetical protein